MIVNKKMINVMMFYTIITTIFFVLFFSNYHFFNIYVLDFFLSFFIIGYFVLYYCFKRMLISIEVIFNIFGILYSNYYILENFILQNQPIIPSVGNTMMLAHLSILMFNIAFCMTSVSKVNIFKENKYIYNLHRMKKCLFLFLIISIFAEIYVVFLKIGYRYFISASRASKTLLMADYSLLSFYKSTIPMIMSIYLYFFLKNKDKKSLFLFFVTCLLSIFNAVMSASRAELISVLLPVIFLLYYFKVISNKKIIILSIVIFLFFGMWKSLFWGEVNISFDSEFDSWYKISINILSNSKNSYLFGKSYIKTFINLFIPVTNFESLSTWYVKNYELSVYNIGGGRGFSCILEAFMNFGILGNIIIFMFLGWFVKKLKIKNDFQMIVYMIILISVYQVFRAESYSLLKNMMWFKIYPILIIYAYSRKYIQKGKIKNEIQ